MKRIALFALAALAAALIVAAALVYRRQNQAAAVTGITLLPEGSTPREHLTPEHLNTGTPIALLPEGLTPSPVPAGLLPQPQAVPFPGTVTAVIPHDFFPLSGAHATLPCVACHDDSAFAGISAACVDCHAARDIHNGANGPDCALCHVPTQWQDATFDHSVIGQRDCGECHGPPPDHFPGACSTCHLDTTNFFNVTFDHGTVIGTDCAACHAPPPNHFPGACSACHNDTTNFRNVNFAHTFPLDHGDANRQCATCHPGNNTTTYTCTACHEQNEMIEEHADEDIFNIANCVACHPDGEEPDH